LTEPELFIAADGAFAGVIAQIKEDQWGMTLPAWFQVGGSGAPGLTLKNIINYHTYDEAWVPAVLSGLKLADAENVPTSMDDDLLGDDPIDAYTAKMNSAIAAVRSIDNLEMITHLSYGDWKASDYLLHVASFRGFRAFDIAKLIGISTTLPDELVQGMWDAYSPNFDEWRAMGVFQAAVPVADDALLQDKLIAGSGRNPR
jgi:hypothetical protein